MECVNGFVNPFPFDVSREEDYVFGSSTADARHWDEHLLKVLEDNKDELGSLFNQ